MALTANISDTFQIYITSDAAETKTISNPGNTLNLSKYQEFRIINVKCFNDGGTGNLTLTDGTNNIVAAQATLNGSWKDMVITQANANISATESLVVTTAGGGWNANSRIILDCVGTNGGDSLTVN